MLRSIAASFLGTFVVLALVACGGKSSAPPQTAGSGSGAATGTEPAPGDKGELMLAKMREYKAQVCACADAACISAAQEAIVKWAEEHAEELKDVKPTPEQDAAANKLDEEISACEGKHASTSTGTGAGTMTSAEVLGKFREFKTMMCACKDAACIEKAEKAMMEWAMGAMDQIKDLKPTPAEDAEADKIQADMESCKAKVQPAAKP